MAQHSGGLRSHKDPDRFQWPDKSLKSRVTVHGAVSGIVVCQDQTDDERIIFYNAKEFYDLCVRYQRWYDTNREAYLRALQEEHREEHRHVSAN
jgi:hypothetical protein